ARHATGAAFLYLISWNAGGASRVASMAPYHRYPNPRHRGLEPRRPMAVVGGVFLQRSLHRHECTTSSLTLSSQWQLNQPARKSSSGTSLPCLSIKAAAMHGRHARQPARAVTELARSTGAAQLGALTSMYQPTNTASAHTITPAQYQPRSASSLIGSSSLFPEGIIHPFFARLRGVLREVSPRAHRGAWVIGTDALLNKETTMISRRTFLGSAAVLASAAAVRRVAVAVVPARWENVRARDFDGAPSNPVQDN